MQKGNLKNSLCSIKAYLWDNDEADCYCQKWRRPQTDHLHVSMNVKQSNRQSVHLAKTKPAIVAFANAISNQ